MTATSDQCQLIGPTRQQLAIQLGTVRADRARLLGLIFAIEYGLADGTAPDHWRALLTAARWIAEREEGAPPC